MISKKNCLVHIILLHCYNSIKQHTRSMSPVIRIPDSTYERLKRFAEPFVDSPADIIDKALDSLEQQKEVHRHVQYTGIDSRMRFDPDDPPDLTHTRVLEVRIDGDTKKPKWNHLVRHIHGTALKTVSSFSELEQASLANLQKGVVDERGFHYAPELGFSIQSVSANQAWGITYHLAKQLGIQVEVRFEWMKKEKAAHPGAQAILTVPHT